MSRRFDEQFDAPDPYEYDRDWEYVTFKHPLGRVYGKLYLDNGKVYPPTKDNQFANKQEADEYLRLTDLRATIR